MKKECRGIRELLGPYHDRELDARRTGLVESHLATCAGCRHELAQLARLTDLVQRAKPPELADDYYDLHRLRVWRRVRQEPRQRQPFYRPSFLWPRVATLAGSLIVVMVVAVVGWQMIRSGRHLEQLPVGAVRAVPDTMTQQAPVVAAKPASSAAEVRSVKKEPAPPLAAAQAPRRENVQPQTAGVPTRAAGEEQVVSPTLNVAKAAPEPAREEVRSAARHDFAAQPRSRPPRVIRGARLTEKSTVPLAPVTGASAGGKQERELRESVTPPASVAQVPEPLAIPPLPAVDQDETSTVVFRLTTDSLGRVVGAAIARSSGRFRLDSIALEAIRRSKFRMSTPTQQKSGSSFEYPLKFKPKKKARD